MEPALTSSQVSGLEDALLIANAGASGSQAQLAKLTANIQSQKNLESGMLSLFAYNNMVVISQYELERRYMDGQTVQNPIQEIDVDNFANTVSGNRLMNGTQLVPQRIPQFDGAPLIYADPGNTTDINEVAQYNYQLLYSNLLSIGFSSGLSLVGTVVTTDPVNSGITSISILNQMIAIAFAPGQMLGISDGTNVAVVKITGVTQTTVGVMPSETYSYVLTYTYVLPPLGVVSGGAKVYGAVPAFSNSARASLSGSPQEFLTAYANGMRTSLQIREQALLKEIAAFNANGNDLKSAQALINMQTSLSFVQNFLANFDLTDSGLGKLNNEMTFRRTQITQRVLDIQREILNGPMGSFYDRRYSLAAARCTLGNGSLYVLIQLQNQLVALQAGQASASSLAARWSSFLPT